MVDDIVHVQLRVGEADALALLGRLAVAPLDDALGEQLLAGPHEEVQEGGVRDQVLGARLQNQPVLHVLEHNVALGVKPVQPGPLVLRGKVDGGASGVEFGVAGGGRGGHGNGVMEGGGWTKTGKAPW